MFIYIYIYILKHISIYISYMCAVCRSVFYPRIVHRTVLIGPLAMGPASWGLLKRRWSRKIACWTPKILLSFWRKSAAGLESSKDFVSAEKVLSQSPKICRCFRTFFCSGLCTSTTPGCLVGTTGLQIACFDLWDARHWKTWGIKSDQILSSFH